MAWLIDQTKDYQYGDNGNWKRDTTPYTKAYLALHTRRGALWFAAWFGTGLYEIEEGTDKGEETEKAVVDDIARTLQFLVDSGEIAEVTTKVQRSATNKIFADTVLRGGDGAVYRMPRRVLGAYANSW